MNAPTFNQLKKTFLDSGYEIRSLPQRELESLALDAPSKVKRHFESDIYGIILPDQDAIGIAREISVEEKTTTLLHELIHLFNDNLPEDEVEEITEEIENNLSPDQYGFLQFLVT